MMEFEILDFKRKKNQYDYTVKGENVWGIPEIIPYMLEVAKRSTYYKLMVMPGLSIVDKRCRGGRAEITLRETLDARVNHILVKDYGIGKQMIDKFVRAVEVSES